jgi:hypothetical protein
MPRRTVSTDEAPKAVGPYSQAVVSGGFVFTAGQIPLNPATGELEQPDIETATRRVLANVGAERGVRRVFQRRPARPLGGPGGGPPQRGRHRNRGRGVFGVDSTRRRDENRPDDRFGKSRA